MKKKIGLIVVVLLSSFYSVVFGQSISSPDGGVIPLDGGNCSLTIHENNQPLVGSKTINYAAQNITFTTITNGNCTVLRAVNEVDWITIPNSNSISGSFQINVIENNTPHERVALIYFTDANDRTVAHFGIRQTGNANLIAYYTDTDGDGFGDFNAPINYATTQPVGFVANNLDFCPNEASTTNNGCKDAVSDQVYNWTKSYTYDRDGRLIGASKGYFDDLGKVKQSQSYDIRKKRIWATETRYDNKGRPRLSTLGAPITNEISQVSFEYNTNFIKKVDGSDFIASDYENDQVDPAVVGTQALTLGNYYSAQYTDEKLRDITNRPYSKNIYSDLSPGAVKQVVGGNKMNDEWKQGYSFSMLAAQEPYYVLGYASFESQPEIAVTYDNISSTIINDTTKQIAWLKAIKSVSQSVDNVEVVTFTDADGKTIGAARSGGTKQYEVLSLIGEQKFIDIHIPIGCENTATLLTSATDYRIYDLKTEEVVAATELQNAGFYRIEYIGTRTFTKASNLTYIDKSAGTIHPVENNAVGIRYNVNYYDFSLNEYDDVGRLTKSMQPLGFNDACLDNLSATVNHNENLKSTFTYDTLGQLIMTTSPDEGTATFKYRKDGQIRFSQNTKQAYKYENLFFSESYSYTNYDELGRPVESGVCYIESGGIGDRFTNFEDLDPDEVNFVGNRKEQHFTKYDYLENEDLTYLSNINGDYGNPSFLSGNVAKTYNLDNATPKKEISITYYSYDVYGRIVWIVQKIKEITGNGYKTVTIDYEYDPISSQVTKVIFQKNVPGELFVHRYSYDVDTNELLKVETSTDNSTFMIHAEYDYYESGALRQTTLAEGIQDIDYVYNLNGQLKAINHPSLANDPEINPNGTDLFGMTLDYYTNDYLRNSNFTQYSDGTDQYNGNIKSMTWNTDAGGNKGTLQYRYTYDKNNWLTSALFNGMGNQQHNAPENVTLNTGINTTQQITATTSIIFQPGFHVTAANSRTFSAKIVESSTNMLYGAGDYDVTNLEYDANGNIKKLFRNKNTERINGDDTNSMDQLRYEYYANKPNQLKRVDDAVISDTHANDIKDQVGNAQGNNYIYNEIGQLTENIDEHVGYEYNASGLVTAVRYNGNKKVEFIYNDKNFRTRKITYQSDGQTPQKITDYILDTSGSALAIYEDGVQKELPIYGANRLGVYNKTTNTSVYQLTDHLGNVRVVIAKQGSNAIALQATDYYPFGMPMPNRQIINGEPYRYAYQGQEKDSETGKEAFQLRLWDARLGRWLTTDPYGQFSSPYLGMGNNPMNGTDPDGGKFFTDFIIKETGERHKVNDGIEQVVSISQKDFNSLMKSWKSFDIGYYFAQLQDFTPLNLSVSDFDAIAGTLFAEGSAKMSWQEAAGIYSVMENRANSDGTTVLDVASGGGIYGYDERDKINSIYANKAQVNNAYKGLIEGYYGGDFSNGGYFWHGKDFSLKNWKAHKSYYLTGFKFTDKAHDLWNLGNHKSKHNWQYKYESTAAFGGTTFMRLTSQWQTANGSTRWNGR
ncbi:RHS repeat-associated core domain-containing protein [Tenacibaculum amylolyticum]|uniref:RHS repeat-associated core domain-containing protein n=1 Tax=Tenacibaculum amylolyticum TaxID=104269 RepID=UPI003892F91E